MKNKKDIVVFLFNDFKSDIRVWKESKTLADNGYNVTVAAISGPNLQSKEIKNGVKIQRLSIPGSLPFPFSLILYWLRLIKNYRKSKIFHCNDLYALPPAVVIKIIFNRKVKIVYDCHELETEAHVYFKKPFLKAIVKLIERLCIKKADSVITVSDSIAEDYKKRYKIDKPKLILNCPYFKKYQKKNLIREKLNIPNKKKIILYQGDFTHNRGIDLMIKAFNNLNNDKFVLVLLGKGPEKKNLENQITGNNVYFHDRVSVDSYMDILASADIGIHLLENICLNNYYALPNKLFEYSMAGLPVIISNMKEMSAIVKKYEIGIILKSNSSEELTKVVNNLQEKDLRKFKNNLAKVNKIYNWENQEKTLINIYNNL